MLNFDVNKKALKEFLNDRKGVVISEKEVKELLNYELSKPEKEIDIKLVNSCVDLMLHMKGIEVPELSKSENFTAEFSAPQTAAKKVRFNKYFRTAIAACLVLVIVFTANAVSIGAFNFNIPNHIAKWCNNIYTLFGGDDSNVNDNGDEDLWNRLRSKMEENNFSSIKLPDVNDFNFALSSVYASDETVVSRNISFILDNSKGDNLVINVADYKSLDYAKLMFKNDVANGDEVEINGETYYYIMANKENRIVFLSATTRYYYSSQTLTKEELQSIVEKIK